MEEQNNVKTNLMNELANIFKSIASEHVSGVPLSKEVTQTLCNVIEAIFIHGLRKPFFLKKPRGSKYPEPNFWPFVSKFTHKAVLSRIASSNQIRTEVGKSRVWVRILLNENTMENYLSLLLRKTAALSKFYEKWAFLRDSERVNVLAGYTKGLSQLIIEAPVNSSFFNTWTPTPLVLSGLMSGEPKRFGQLVKNRLCGGSLDMLDDAELAENALELLCDPAEVSTSSGAGGSEEDDQISVYSHPSMLDEGLTRLSVLDAGNSTVLSNPVPEESALNCDPHQVRVIRRTHRPLRRSSKSTSEDSSRSGSQSGMASELQNVEKDEGNVKIFEISHGNTQPTPVVNLTINSEEKENHEQLTSTSEVMTASLNMDKSFVVRNELSISKSSKNTQDDSMGDISSNIAPDDKAVSSELDKSFNSTAHSLYHLCPEIPLQSEDDFFETAAEKTETRLLHKSSELEQGHSFSLYDELYVAESSSGGNSLLGKGWVQHHQKVDLLEDVNPVSSSTSTNSSRNFDVEIRSVLAGTLEKVVGRENSDDDSSLCETTMHEKERQSMQLDNRTSQVPSNAQEIGWMSNYTEVSDESLIHLLTTIPHEKGLDAQDFRCPECRKSIGPTFASYRTCGFDGKYYCDGCLKKGEESVIPSRLLRNWDGHPRPVCKADMIFIESIKDKAIFRIDKINPKLYSHSQALDCVKFLREKLALSVMYLLSCRKSVAEDLERRLWPKDYLYKDIHLFSFADLLTVYSGDMERHLNYLFNFTTDHIRRCVLCAQKGFICEVCSSAQVIYPFQLEVTSRCPGCYSVYHKNCLEQQQCPKCIRMERYSQQQPKITPDHLILDMD